MRRSLTLLAGCLVSLGLAMPHEQAKKAAALKVEDTDILNYALTLEYLERKFYKDGLKNFTEKDFTGAGFTKDFYTNLKVIGKDEDVSSFDACHVVVCQR